MFTICSVALTLWLSACGGGGVSSPLPAGPSAFYRFNEAPGASTVVDSAPAPTSTVADNGILYNQAGNTSSVQAWWVFTGDSAPMQDTNTPNGGMYFYGNYVEVAHSADLDFGTGDFTIATWVNPVMCGPTFSLLDKTQGGTGYALYLDKTGAPPNTAKVLFWMNGVLYSSTGTVDASYTPPTPSGSFTSIAIVVDRTANSVSIYINGALDSTHTIPAGVGSVSNPASLLIADTRIVSNTRCEYTMSGLIFYKRALTPSEVNVIYTSGVGAL